MSKKGWYILFIYFFDYEIFYSFYYNIHQFK